MRSTAAKQLAQLAVKGVISDVSIVEDDLKSAQSRQQVALVDGAAWSELLSVVARVGKVYSLKFQSIDWLLQDYAVPSLKIF